MRHIKIILLCAVILVNTRSITFAIQGDNMYNAIDIGVVSACAGLDFYDTQYTNDFQDDGGATRSPDIFYKFTLLQRTTVTISHCESDFDTYLSLLNEYGNTIESVDDNGPVCSGRFASMIITLDPGIYYVLSEGYDDDLYGNVTTQVLIPGIGVPNSGTNMSNAINAGAIQNQAFTDSRNSTCYGDDYGEMSEDIFYKFTLSSAAQVLISNCGSEISTSIYLLSATGSVIPTNSQGGALCTSNPSVTASLPSGTYYLVTEGYSGYPGISGIINTSISIYRGDADLNYVTNKVYDLDGNIIAESRSYYDNTGASLQTQAKNISAGKILASQTLFDALHRAAVTGLTAPLSSNSFGYNEKLITNSQGSQYNFRDFDLAKTDNPVLLNSSTPGTLGWYYSNNNTYEGQVAATGYPYSRTVYHDDGSGLIKKSSAPGEVLKPGSGHEVQSFAMPVVNELSHYLQVRNKFFTSSQMGMLPTSFIANASQGITKDENGKESVLIQDRSGSTLMSARPGSELQVSNTYSTIGSTESSTLYIRLFQATNVTVTGTHSAPVNMDTGVQVSGPSSSYSLAAGYYKFSLSGAQVSYSNGYADISYNFYNQLGQLVASIAPEGVKKLIQNINAYTSLAQVPFVTSYEYDTQGRLVGVNSADAGRSEFVYRADGRIRFSQNSEQRKTGRFSYTNYDVWLRPVESGEYVPGSITFETAKTSASLQESTAADGGLSGGTKKNWVKTYYDYVDNSHGLTGFIQDEFFLHGAVSCTENEQSKTWYGYDTEGRVSWVIKRINGLGSKTINYAYNAQGSVSKVDYQKNTPSERFIHEYEYDADGRLSAAYTTTDPNVARKLQAKYHYYLHGPLKRVELAQNLQGIDYTYTPQGWLKTINHPEQSKDPGKDGTANSFAPDVFGMTLEYFNGDYSRSGTGITSLGTGTSKNYYNGTISGQSWRSTKPASIVSTYGSVVNNPAMFTYEYDDKYQFNSNKYGAPNFTSNSFSEAVNKNREYGLNYDAHGNILSMNRTDHNGTMQSAFTYHYQPNTNKLSSVNDYATYEYDDLGQPVKINKADRDFFLSYDVSGKLTGIYSDAARTQLVISFGYDESGNRIRKTDHTQNVSTYYVTDAAGNVLAIYDNNGSSLQQKEVPVYAAGRIGIYQKQSGAYWYELNDHLGNVRAVIGQNKTSGGLADVAYYSDYYPFGSTLTYQGSVGYRYGYQGQFAETDQESAWVNFALRMYDPAIGRWMTTDPYGQYHSPYVGMGNDPIAAIDRDGGWVHIAIGGLIGAGVKMYELSQQGKLGLNWESAAKIGYGALEGAAVAAAPTLASSIVLAGIGNMGGQAIDNAFSGNNLLDIHYEGVGLAMTLGATGYRFGKRFEKLALAKLTSMANRVRARNFSTEAFGTSRYIEKVKNPWYNQYKGSISATVGGQVADMINKGIFEAQIRGMLDFMQNSNIGGNRLHYGGELNPVNINIHPFDLEKAARGR